VIMSMLPLAPVDADGRSLATDCMVTVLSVASCAEGLPRDDQDRLKKIVGQRRRIVRLDEAGFVWLCFVPDELGDDFCLFPSEVQVA